MSLGILGKKVGMTRVYDEDGAMVPVTVIDVSGNTLLQKRTKETDGYVAVQVGYDNQKESRVTKARSGHLINIIQKQKDLFVSLGILMIANYLKRWIIHLQKCSKIVNL